MSHLPGQLSSSAEAVRALAATASSLGAELAGKEAALARAEASASAIASSQRLAPADDTDRQRSLAVQASQASQEIATAQGAIAGITARWTSACRGHLGGVTEVVALLGAVATPPPRGPDRTSPPPPGAPGFGDGIAAAEGIVTSTASRAVVHGTGVWLFGQRVDALHDMARAWIHRGYLRATGDLRAFAAGAREFATLRWTRIGPAVEASHATSAARIGQQTDRISTATDVVRNGRGVARVAGKVLAPVGMLADGMVVYHGSQYDGTHGRIDTGMAVVGIASGITLAVGAAVASPVILGVAAIGAGAAALWGVGNLINDNRQAISSAATAVGRGIADGASAVGRGVRDGAGAVARGVGRVFGSGG